MTLNMAGMCVLGIRLEMSLWPFKPCKANTGTERGDRAGSQDSHNKENLSTRTAASVKEYHTRLHATLNEDYPGFLCRSNRSS